MEKIFNSFKELLSFDFTKLEPQKSNYLRLIPSDGNLPKVKKEFQPKKWRVITREPKTEIIFEITPRWLTITIHGLKDSTRENFEINKNPKELIERMFEE